ncbi:MAG: hypothetical protein M0R06_16260 [Sphaerochaeta sp.]|jgi:hypothetical protein|nr:hypothetical protein [Sphaerochaeta sp.]
MTPEILSWFESAFPGDKVDFPLPAVMDDGTCYVLIPLSRLAEVRQVARLKPLPVPLVPVLVIDCDSKDRPKGKWLYVSRKSTSVGLDEKSFNKLMEAMNSLPETSDEIEKWLMLENAFCL